MAVFLSPMGGVAAQFFDNNGNPLSGGRLYTYLAGTTTPVVTYTTSLGNTAWTNPIVLDAAGRVPNSGEIWLTDGIIYKFVLKTSADVLIATWDNINGINSNFVNYTIQEEVITATSGQTVFNLSTITYVPNTNSLAVYVDGVNQIVTNSYVETNANTVTFVSGLHVGALVKFTTAIPVTGTATDAAVVSYDPPFTGSVSTTVEAKLAQYVSVKDFGAVGDGSDETAKVQAMLDATPTGGGDFLINQGVKFDLTALTFPQNCNLVYYAQDDLSTPGQASDIGSGELVYFSANSSYPTDPTGGAVNEWRMTAAFHPGMVTDVRKDVTGANSYLGPSQTLTEPARNSWGMMDEQVPSFITLYQSYSSNSIFSGVTSNTYRRVVTLNGVGTGNWPSPPSVGNLVTGVTSGAAGFVISVDASSTVLYWFSGRFVAGENLHLASPSATSTSTVTSVAFATTQMQPLSQDLQKGNWSIGLPPLVPTNLFTVGGKIAATQARTFGQYDPYAVTNPSFVWHDLVSDVPTNGFEIVYNTMPSAASRRLTLRNMGSSADRGLVGAVGCSTNFNNGVIPATSSFNVASIVRNGTGDYTVTFTNAFTTADFAVGLSTSKPLEYAYVYAKTIGVVRIRVVTTGTSTLVDLTGELSLICTGGDI